MATMPHFLRLRREGVNLTRRFLCTFDTSSGIFNAIITLGSVVYVFFCMVGCKMFAVIDVTAFKRLFVLIAVVEMRLNIACCD